MKLFNFFTQDVAIDLGTANTLIIHNNKVVVDSPSIVAIDRRTNKVIAVGEKAKHMQGKTRSEERRVGKEWRYRWWEEEWKKKWVGGGDERWTQCMSDRK